MILLWRLQGHVLKCLCVCLWTDESIWVLFTMRVHGGLFGHDSERGLLARLQNLRLESASFNLSICLHLTSSQQFLFSTLQPLLVSLKYVKRVLRVSSVLSFSYFIDRVHFIKSRWVIRLKDRVEVCLHEESKRPWIVLDLRLLIDSSIIATFRWSVEWIFIVVNSWVIGKAHLWRSIIAQNSVHNSLLH